MDRTETSTGSFRHSSRYAATAARYARSGSNREFGVGVGGGATPERLLLPNDREYIERQIIKNDAYRHGCWRHVLCGVVLLVFACVGCLGGGYASGTLTLDDLRFWERHGEDSTTSGGGSLSVNATTEVVVEKKLDGAIWRPRWGGRANGALNVTTTEESSTTAWKPRRRVNATTAAGVKAEDSLVPEVETLKPQRRQQHQQSGTVTTEDAPRRYPSRLDTPSAEPTSTQSYPHTSGGLGGSASKHPAQNRNDISKVLLGATRERLVHKFCPNPPE